MSTPHHSTARSRDRDSQRGQILVIVAGGLIGLLAIAALVLEGGTLLLNRRDAQNSADISSMAATRIVALNYTQSPKTQADVWTAIRGSLDLNDCPVGGSPLCVFDATFVGGSMNDLGNVNDTAAALPTGALGVRVAVTRQPGALLGRVLGQSTWTVTSEATAVVAERQEFPSGTMLPIAVCAWVNPSNPNDCWDPLSGAPTSAAARPFTEGQIYDLTDGKDAPGGFGWLSWDGSNSAGALSDSVCEPNNPSFKLDDPYDNQGSYGGVMGTNPATGETWFPIDPGKSNKSSMRACLDHWIATGATVLVPMYDIVTGTGNGAAYHITGVAAFILTSREQPAVDNIQGTFVAYYNFADVPGGAGWVPPTAESTTVFLGLVR